MLIFFLIIIFAMILWWLLRAASIVLVIQKMKKANWKEWVKVLQGFLKTRSEIKLLCFFMSTEAGLAGIFPQCLKAFVSVKTQDIDVDFWIELGNNADYLSFAIAIIIAIGYFLYLWLTNRKHPEHWKEVIEASRLINEELNFIPTETWFAAQNKKAIVNLGKRYSESRNFPFKQMDFALASLCMEDRFRYLLHFELKYFVEQSDYFIRSNNEKTDEEYLKLSTECEAVKKDILSLDGTVDAFLRLRKKLKEFENIVSTYYWESLDRSKHETEYPIRNLRDATSKLRRALSNEWIEHKKHHTLFIVGEAGTGKSHLIGDMVTIRKNNNNPSILLLGQHFTNASDPLTQIKEMLDIMCKKERILKQLDNYGKRVGTPVVIFIDAINEGAGEALWKNFLTDIISAIEIYDYLRLVISFRISARKNWFYDLAHDDSKSVYHHRGFEGNEREACEYMFCSFGLDQPMWPVFGDEFANPLFLIKYCRNHERSGQPLKLEDFWTTISNYCVSTNHELAQHFGYNDSLDLVTDSLKAVAELMVEGGSRYQLEFQTVIKRLTDVAKYTSNPKEFLDLLIDEGLLRTETYERKTFIEYGFERIGDYFIADYLIERKAPKEWYEFHWGDISEAISIIVPLKKNVEAFEIVPKENKNEAINSFIHSAGWRDEFCSKGQTFVQHLKEQKKYSVLYEIIAKRPFRADKNANGATLYELLWDKTMVQRDAIWTTVISNDCGEGCSLMDLAKWGMEVSSETLNMINDTTCSLCAEILIWSFASTWRELRDRSTHALVNILANHTSIIHLLLKKYYLINDPYIEERLWASVFGALLCSQDKDTITRIGIWTYHTIFCSNSVPKHILVRDYAKEIVRYAQSLKPDLKIEERKISLPYDNGELPDIPSSDEIKARFEKDWQSIPEDEKAIYRVQSAILNSMATEHSSRTMYGDFGRYVFQASINDFGEDVELMSNWAIQMIFDEFGYDPKVFADFDSNHSSRDRSHSSIERIGKKYQWIAMYRIMAHLSDLHPDLDLSKAWVTPVRSARNIDPTMKPGLANSSKRSIYDVPAYNILFPKDDMKWLKSWKRMPKIEEYLFTKDGDSKEWINLFSYNTIVHKPNSLSDNSSLNRDLWTFVQAFAVDKTAIKTVCDKIHKYGLAGRGFHENGEVYGIFSREFFWSDEYKTIVTSSNFGNIEFSVSHVSFPNIIIEPAYLQYNQSSSSDASSEDSILMLLPNEWIYKGLGLMYAKENGAWIDTNGNVAILDNNIYNGGHRALLARKDIILTYLNKKNKYLFWPILIERMIHTEHAEWADHRQCGGWAYMDENGVIHCQFKSYEPSNIQKKWKKWKNITLKRIEKILLYLHQRHLIWLPEKRKLKLYYGDDYSWLFNIKNESAEQKEQREELYKNLEALTKFEEEDNNS